MFRQEHTKWTKLFVGFLFVVGGGFTAATQKFTTRGVAALTGRDAVIAGAAFFLVGAGVLIWTYLTEFKVD
jgi:hypothetical protein